MDPEDGIAATYPISTELLEKQIGRFVNIDHVAVEVGLMGSLSVVRDGHGVATGGPKQQLVLAVLALAAGTPVSTDRLIDLVWDDRPPRTARRTMQSYISSLRPVLGADARLLAQPGGYVLDIPRQQVDLLAFEDEVSSALARTDAVPDAIAATLQRALSRWVTPLELTKPTPSIATLLLPFEELRLQAVEALVAAQIDSGRARDAVRRLEILVRESPTRENLWLQLARGLATLGRRDAALRAIQRAREQMREQLGVEPSGALQQYEQALLNEPGPGAVDSDPGRDRPALPGGRVTFVFTDIEGSTKLLRSLGDRYQSVLDEHRRILRDAWAANDGHEINVDGDAFFVAFDDTSSAVRACIAAQEGLGVHPGPEGHPVRVRMGIHSGLAYPRHGDYAALTVHQAARIADSAHGEQVLISSDAAEVVPTPLADRLHALGRFRVRDFDEPVPLFGVDTGMSVMHEHSPRLIPADGHNLTSPSGVFVARTNELAQIPQLLKPGDLVTVTGPGGVGKTRLAIEVGFAVAVSFVDGVWMAALDSIDEPEVIGTAIADAVGATPRGRSDLWRELLDHLADARALLIIDNCEHLLAGCADRVAELLQRCPRLTVLATSRVPLGLIGERIVRLDPLTSASSGQGPSEAVQLFVDRAARPPPAESTRATREIEQLCAEVDGLPLAIELVASRTDTMTPSDIRNALAVRSPMLSTGDPRVPERQRSLARLLDWSYRLLTPAEQAALRRLTVFSASFDRTTAATAVSDGDTPEEVAELVWSLAGKSLVSVEPAAGTSRYRLLRTVRSYAVTHLEESERVDASRRLAERFTATIGPDVVVDRKWVGDMALELNNVRSLVLVTGIDERLRQKLAWSIAQFHDLTDDFATGIQEVSRHLEVLPGETPERVALLTLMADMQLRVGDLTGATRSIEAADALLEEVGPASWDDAGVQRTRSDLAMRAGRHAEARQIIEDALEGQTSARGQARLFDVLGLSLAETDEYDGSDAAFRRELELWSDVGDDTWAATTLGNLAETALRRGRLDEAARHQLACLDVARSLGQPLLVAFAIVVAAQISARREQWHDALGLQLAADSVLAEVGYVLFETDERARQELLNAARDRLGIDAGRASESHWSGLPLEVAIETAARTLESAIHQKEQPWRPKTSPA